MEGLTRIKCTFYQKYCYFCGQDKQKVLKFNMVINCLIQDIINNVSILSKAVTVRFF